MSLVQQYIDTLEANIHAVKSNDRSRSKDIINQYNARYESKNEINSRSNNLLKNSRRKNSNENLSGTESKGRRGFDNGYNDNNNTKFSISVDD